MTAQAPDVPARPVRKRFLLLLVAVVVVALYLTLGIPRLSLPGVGTKPYHPSASQLAAARAAVAAVPAPAGARIDVNATACHGVGDVCFTAARLTSRALFTATVGAIQAQGAHVLRRCVDPADGECVAAFWWHDTSVTVGNPVDLLPVEPPAAVAIFVNVPEDAPTELPASGPLGPWADLAVEPSGWTGAPPCTAVRAGGCQTYTGTLRAPGTVSSAYAALLDRLHSRGFRLDQDRCVSAPATQDRTCTVAAVLFRAPHGGQGVLVIAHVRRTTPGDVVTAAITASAL